MLLQHRGIDKNMPFNPKRFTRFDIVRAIINEQALPGIAIKPLQREPVNSGIRLDQFLFARNHNVAE